jgi:hypothetical protein
MKVVFNKDYYGNRKGLSGTVNIACGGMLTGQNGVIDMRNEKREIRWLKK